MSAIARNELFTASALGTKPPSEGSTRSTALLSMARITSIVFDRNEQPLRASIRTHLGTVKVRWLDVCGDRCWQTSGILDAKKLVAAAVARIERMVSHR